MNSEPSLELVMINRNEEMKKRKAPKTPKPKLMPTSEQMQGYMKFSLLKGSKSGFNAPPPPDVLPPGLMPPGPGMGPQMPGMSPTGLGPPPLAPPMGPAAPPPSLFEEEG
jgi:hypothetical protein